MSAALSKLQASTDAADDAATEGAGCGEPGAVDGDVEAAELADAPALSEAGWPDVAGRVVAGAAGPPQAATIVSSEPTTINNRGFGTGTPQPPVDKRGRGGLKDLPYRLTR
jgi:hypothetical protein